MDDELQILETRAKMGSRAGSRAEVQRRHIEDDGGRGRGGRRGGRGVDKAIRKELEEERSDPSDDWSCAVLEEGDYSRLRGMILVSAASSPFSGGVFEIVLEVADNYPYTPPEVLFVTPVFHPFVDPESGLVSLPLLSSEWSPAECISTVMQAVHEMLVDVKAAEDNGARVVHPEAGDLWCNNRDAFVDRAKETTAEYAI